MAFGISSGDLIGIVMRSALRYLTFGEKSVDAVHDMFEEPHIIVRWKYKNVEIVHKVFIEDIMDNRLDRIFREMRSAMKGRVDPYDTDPLLKGD